jgi:hypothetical protein
MRCLHPVLLGTASLLYVAATQAHIDKPFDQNGGHWDNQGFYHCHLDGCVPTADRNRYRSRPLSNNQRDLYFLEEDWPFPEIAEGCKTMRTVVLENTSRVPVTWTNPRQCEIREGLWIDEYTGEEFTRAAALEVDHIIPRMYANATNGYQWDYGKRVQFANDPYNLIPVGRETARKKRDRGIGQWRPPNEAFLCDYAQAWKDISEKYDLDLINSDTGRMNNILKDCVTESSQTLEE